MKEQGSLTELETVPDYCPKCGGLVREDGDHLVYLQLRLSPRSEPLRMWRCMNGHTLRVKFEMQHTFPAETCTYCGESIEARPRRGGPHFHEWCRGKER